jgi:serine protease Do
MSMGRLQAEDRNTDHSAGPPSGGSRKSVPRPGPCFFRVFLLFLAAAIAMPGEALGTDAHAGADLRRSPVVRAVEKVSPAVVNIGTVIRERVGPGFPFTGEDFFRDFFPEFFSREYTRSSLGSGVIIDGERGHVVTNHHVVSRAAEIKVTTADGNEFQARVLGSDPRSDLAVLEIKADKRLPEVSLGDSSDLMIGETVIAIGNPFGLSHTVTTGVVSAIDRTVRSGDMVYRNFIQTDASINPGNSGGPLLNITGDLIGINTAIYQKAQGIGFAIPVNRAGRIIGELIRAGEVRFPWLGVEIQELTADLRRHFSAEEEKGGVLISGVFSDGPADKAGLRRGDILLGVGDENTDSVSDFRAVMSEYTPGADVDLRVFRGGRHLVLGALLASFPPGLALELVRQRMGLEVADAGRAVLRKYRLGSAVVIEDVKSGSEAAETGLRPGDLILKVNDVETPDVEAFKKAVSRYHQLPSLTLYVRRGSMIYSLSMPF